MDWLQHFDVTLFRFLNGKLINPVFDQVMPLLSGNAFFIPAVILLGLVVIWKYRARGAVFFILLALSVALADGVICRTVKKAVGRERPFMTLPDARCLLGRGGSASMPSSHAANWFAGTMVAYVFFRRSAWVMFPLACAVSFSRVYCGVHYPSDVAAGAVFGAGTGAAALWLANELWTFIGKRAFPLWWAKYPSLLAPPPAGDDTQEQEPQFAPRRKPGEKPAPPFAPPHASLDDHWLRLGYLLLALLLVSRLAYISSRVIQLSPEEAFHWLQSRNLHALSLHDDWLMPLLAFLGTWLFGNTAFGVRLFAPLLSALAGFVLLRFVAKNVNARAGFFLILITTATPMLVAHSILLTPEVLSIPLSTVLLVSAWRAVQPNSEIGAWLLVGVWSSLLFLCGGFQFLSFFLALFLFLIFWKPARRQFRGAGPWLASLMYLSCTLGIIRSASVPLKEQEMSSSRGPGPLLFCQILVANPVFLIAALWAAVALWKRNRHHPFLVYCFFLGGIPFALTPVLSTHWSATAPALIPLLCLMIAFWDLKWRLDPAPLKPWLVMGLVLGLAACLLGHETNWVSKLTGRPLPVHLDPLGRLRGWSDTSFLAWKKREELLPEDRPVFLITSDPGLAAELSFYAPESKLGSDVSPPVYVLPDRQPDLDRAPGYSLRRGQSAVFVSLGRENVAVRDLLSAQFQSVADTPVQDVLYHGQVLRSLRFYLCRNLQ